MKIRTNALCDGRCIYPQDLLEEYYSSYPAYIDDQCSVHGVPDDTCACPVCNPEISLEVYNNAREV